MGEAFGGAHERLGEAFGGAHVRPGEAFGGAHVRQLGVESACWSQTRSTAPCADPRSTDRRLAARRGEPERIEGIAMSGEPSTFSHRPVLVREIGAIFEPIGPGVVVDATVGGGGHAAALLEANPDLSIIGVDQDGDALVAAAERLQPFGDRVVLRRARFDALTEVAGRLGHERVAGVLFDLGVSSPQLDRGDRGFSYRHDGPLDMRMDRDRSRTAADVVNGYAEADLARLLREYGDERFASRIARAIVGARPLTTTVELADVVRGAIPAGARRTGGHPAKRSFQAIRIEVNDELRILGQAIDDAVDLLRPGGRLAVLAYHSGEDRVVKGRLREAETGGCVCPPGLPCGCGATPKVRLLTRGSRRPRADEIATNPRAESARLRSAERLDDTA